MNRPLSGATLPRSEGLILGPMNASRHPDEDIRWTWWTARILGTALGLGYYFWWLG
jgi:hypothetical protein